MVSDNLFLFMKKKNKVAIIVPAYNEEATILGLLGRVAEQRIDGVNIEVLTAAVDGVATMRVHERGSGETMACGTGACAAVVAGCLQGQLDDTVEVQLRGGQLSVNWRQQDSHVLMTGPVTTVYEGSVQL